ncbi:HlyD family efflux transporter periplasmic adaptor subunit [Cetobacterium sp. 2A]|uniref:HlyD family secretion protein n=1 Tax=Cetobacterium sp. 2A TaxID=2754723 RepID=UPI00163BAB49|nr:efflux RND transporter periplasmic adaptor subunit [Cetobacterium sp. 2A]MBC2855440.1 HlyD family efflux transporter periplasmic adaptor subunit [Cetobacterium sp. 2A]
MQYKNKAKFIYLGIVISFLLVFFINIGVQMNIPYSSRAFLEYQIVPVYSKVSESVENIFVKNGDYVSIGQPLFEVDKNIYIAQYTSALGQYNEVLDSIKNLKNDIEKNKVLVSKNKVLVEQNKKELLKYKKLFDKKYINELDYEAMNTKLIESEKILKESQNTLNNLLVKYKKEEESTPQLLIAEGALKKAEINLKNTTILSPISGEVVMDNFYQNTLIKQDTTLFYVKNDNILTVNVDLKEKNLKSITKGREALIVFDGISQQVIKGKIEKITSVLVEGFSTSNTLVDITDDNRWVRDPGKIRVSITIENSNLIKNLSSGSKASVILLSESNNIFYDALAKLWINIIRVFNYVY